MKLTISKYNPSVIPLPYSIRPLRPLSTNNHQFHTSTTQSATPLPFATAVGPPPSAPVPAASQYGERVDRRWRQAELLKRGQDLRASQMKPGTAMKKRFWKDVSVRMTPGNSVQSPINMACMKYGLYADVASL